MWEGTLPLKKKSQAWTECNSDFFLLLLFICNRYNAENIQHKVKHSAKKAKASACTDLKGSITHLDSFHSLIQNAFILASHPLKLKVVLPPVRNDQN